MPEGSPETVPSDPENRTDHRLAPVNRCATSLSSPHVQSRWPRPRVVRRPGMGKVASRCSRLVLAPPQFGFLLGGRWRP